MQKGAGKLQRPGLDDRSEEPQWRGVQERPRPRDCRRVWVWRGRPRSELPAGGAPGLRAGRGRKCQGRAGRGRVPTTTSRRRPGIPEEGRAGRGGGNPGPEDRAVGTELRPAPRPGAPGRRASGSTCLCPALAPRRLALVSRGRGGAGSPRQRRAVAREWGHVPSVRGWVSPGSAGSLWLPRPPRPASALLGAPAARPRLGPGVACTSLRRALAGHADRSVTSCTGRQLLFCKGAW